MKYLILLILVGCSYPSRTHCLDLKDKVKICRTIHNSKINCFSDHTSTKKTEVIDCKVYNFLTLSIDFRKDRLEVE